MTAATCQAMLQRAAAQDPGLLPDFCWQYSARILHDLNAQSRLAEASAMGRLSASACLDCPLAQTGPTPNEDHRVWWKRCWWYEDTGGRNAGALLRLLPCVLPTRSAFLDRQALEGSAD